MNLKHYLYLLLLIGNFAFAQSQLVMEAKQAFNQGHYEQAMLHWQTILNANPTLKIRQEATLNIARIYRYLGIYTKAIITLNLAIAQIDDDKAYKSLLINELSKVRMAQGEKMIEQARQDGKQALAMAREANNFLVLAEVLNHQGNLLTTEYEYEEANKLYNEALQILAKSSLQTKGEKQTFRCKILINKAKTLYFLDVDGAYQYAKSSQAFNASTAALQAALLTTQDWDDVYSQILGLINISQIAQKIQQQFTQPSAQLTNIAYQALTTAQKIAKRLNNPAAQAYTNGYLGKLYENAERYAEALTLTRRAQFFTQHAREQLFVSYLWDWQLGRILKAKGENLKAITAYQEAIDNFQPVRSQMTATGYFNLWEQTFRESTAPIYFELADLLLQQASNTPVATKREKLLLQAITTIEQFKEAELQDYFQSDCIDTQSECGDLAKILDEQTAILYPISLPDRLELLLQKRDSLVQTTVFTSEQTLRREIAFFLSPLRRHPNLVELNKSRGLRGLRGLRDGTSKITDAEICTPLLRGNKPLPFTESAGDFAEPAQKLYDWLIKPLHSHLQGIETLVIAPDAALRTIPFAALRDGQQFLIQKYALAVTPSLCFSEKTVVNKETKQILLAGLSKGVQGFSPLPCAKYELDSLHTLFKEISEPLLNEDFVTKKISSDIKQKSYSIVHIASHGQFNANLKNTFILTYDDKLSMNQLERLMSLATVKEKPVDMLTLSACETAVGDDRAALGLAGVALKAGVKTALASLWKVDDEATPAVVIEFYQQLANSMSKAKALQKAQTMMLTDKNYLRYRHPYYWSAFLLIGNWL